MGMLPLTADSLLLALDAPNSSEEGYRENQYSAGMTVNYSKSLPENKGYVYYYVSLTEQFRRKHMFYDSDWD